MPPKKPTADSADVSSSSDAPVQEKKTDAATVRKLATHPSTAVMVKEALKDLDSRKGLSSQAIQSYIKQKYPSVDLVRLKHLVRKALKKGLETGTLMRPANSKVATGATGKFRIAPKVKEAKPTTENLDPNVEKPSKATKDAATKPKKASVAKKKDSANDEATKEQNPPKKTKKEKQAATSEETTSKVAPAKKPKARKAAEDKEDDYVEGAVAKSAPKETSGSKAAKAGSDAPAAKATGKRGRNTAK
ncbi:linker histone H1M [Clinocottus analis]|uniref:linker histone H1M n=1 Tax=Clinocottus analis TaxID=304258 RepID=UPI0035C1E916